MAQVSDAGDGPVAPPAVSLEWVLGANPTAVHVLGPSTQPSLISATSGAGAGAAGTDGLRVAYISGNVGIIYDTAAKTQTLLRGHVSRAVK
jgi:hypothetical protein